MNKRSKIVWWIIGAIVVVGLVAWGFYRNAGGGNVIKIGFIGPLTGNSAEYGQPEENTVSLAVGEINAEGGIDGKPLEVIYEDGKCDGQDAVSAAQKLITVDGVQAIIGGFCSGETVPIVPIAAQNKVVLLSPGASAPALTGASPYFFRDYPSAATQAEILADAAYHKKNWRTVAVVQEQTDFAASLYDTFDQNFQKFGGKTINESFPSDATDFKSTLVKLKSENPDAVFIDTQASQEADLILKQLQEMKWKPSLMLSNAAVGNPAVLAADAQELEGALAAEFVPDSGNTKLQQFVQAYKAKYDQDVPHVDYMSCAYDAVYLLRDGISSVGDDGSKFAAWSRTVNDWQGASGVITIGANGDRTGARIVLEVIKGGQKSILQ
jgi:branched-chain amino acid transport system substrate-binding protein